MTIRQIAITTGGGDAPGLNAVIRAVVVSARNRGWECFGIRDGYDGLLQPEKYADGGVVKLDLDSVRGITHLGGTILGTTNRGDPFRYPGKNAEGNDIEVDRSEDVVAAVQAHEFDALIAIGGDGSMTIAHALCERGLQIIGVPKTIDNDLNGTVRTFGFNSAVTFATASLDRLHSTAHAHRRIMVVEVMGRYAGWIALHAGVSGSADVILIPEIPFDIEIVANKIAGMFQSGRHYAIVIVAEGAFPVGGRPRTQAKEAGQTERLGGIGQNVADKLESLTGRETRTVVLGHLLRGGSPTAFDRLIALRFGAAAVRALEEGCNDCMVALDPPTVRYVPLVEATERMKRVPLDSDTLLTARDLGISFGD
jgi:6-phosphofructokinase 1